MNKKFINVLLSATLVTAASACFTGCKDYDDDIDNLQEQINKINTTLAGLQEKIDAGSVITSVTPTANGIDIKLSDGKTYTITNGKDGANGTDGKDGVDGKNGTVWTIGEDGFWYKDGDANSNGIDEAAKIVVQTALAGKKPTHADFDSAIETALAEIESLLDVKNDSRWYAINRPTFVQPLF